MIDNELWDKANWVATAFAFAPSGKDIPVIVFAFVNEKSALKIFQQWQSQLGKEDTKELLRISIIEGKIAGQPGEYTINLTSNPEAVLRNTNISKARDENIKMATMCRFQRMQYSQGLTAFKSAFMKLNEFYIMPALYDPNTPTGLHPYTDLSILKRVIYFRNAKDISKSDIDCVVFTVQ